MAVNTIPPHLIKRVARRRAAGVSWQVIADGLGRKKRTIEKWPDRYPALWAKYYAEAKGEVVREGHSEAMAYVRHHMRNEDPKICLSATNQFLRLKDSEGDLPAVDDDAIRMAQYARGLSDADVARIFTEAGVCVGDGGVPAAGPE